ncbi:MAG: HPr-rel-A system PqqD family peptide chaperone [Magnetococcales bacterium]|nr:HPr-rel-A system PqqD family peptide chaperone [Magnetococcales bacterium]NGZ26011.1 HPr-rel-A system PqqD family peptide chaperone [Magnetococcales bacterium]
MAYWQVTHWSSCLVEPVQQGAMVYHPGSGQTHYLNELALWLLHRLALSPATVVELAQELEDPTPTAQAALQKLLEELVTRRLVAPCSLPLES